MKKIGLFVILILITLTQTSIENATLDSKQVYHDNRNKVLLFLSLSKYYDEEQYYDAIIQLRAQKTSIDNNLVVFRKSKNPFEMYNLGVKDTPAIVIVSKNGNRYTEIQGTDVSQNDIVKTVKDAYDSGKLLDNDGS